ncbi:hypothetical protein IKE72_00550 [Candidatus Saccharibacteria bacterium]|nr:hypothetical protein [Candidatus Saccharibacteria bacterium]
MTLKTNKKQQKDKGIIIGICLAVVMVIMAVVAVIIAINNGGVSANEFTTTDTKYVIEYPEEFFTDESQKYDYMPKRVYVAYYHDGDTVNGKTMYYEYENGDAASAALEPLKGNLAEEAYTEMVVKGKYVVITASDVAYTARTMSDVESEKDFVESMKKMYEDSKVDDSGDQSSAESNEGSDQPSTDTTEAPTNTTSETQSEQN